MKSSMKYILPGDKLLTNRGFFSVSVDIFRSAIVRDYKNYCENRTNTH